MLRSRRATVGKLTFPVLDANLPPHCRSSDNVLIRPLLPPAIPGPKTTHMTLDGIRINAQYKASLHIIMMMMYLVQRETKLLQRNCSTLRCLQKLPSCHVTLFYFVFILTAQLIDCSIGWSTDCIDTKNLRCFRTISTKYFRHFLYWF